MTAETTAETTAGPPEAPRARRDVPWLAAGAAFLAMLDATVANLAVPDLHADFPGSSLSGLTWVITLYAVLFAALLAPAGRLADLIGRRTLYLWGVGLFTLASLACALAPNVPVLLATRAAQGAAAAAMIPASLALLLRDMPAERRAGAIGLWSATGAFAAALGPSLGGVLVDQFGWRSLFVINVPVGLALVFFGVRLPRSDRGAGRLPDLVGTVLLGGGVGAVALGVPQTRDWSWTDARILALLTGGAALVALALWRSARHPVPALEISLWRNRQFALANAASFLYGTALYTWLLVGVLYLTSEWDYSILKAGFASTPGALTATGAAIVMGRLTGRIGVRPAVVGGALLMAGSGLWAVAALPADPHFVTFWLPVGLLVGTGMGMLATGTASAAALAVNPLQFAGATGLNTTARQLGGALGIAVLAALLPAGAVHDDYGAVYLFATITTVGAALVGLLLTVRRSAS
ncbi:EmrB/QacA subfamily drug resistance transporter [Actinomadura pelletieri DSM 43383]|uniref:EmrB/QacA subfamily drug resistance transporter n=1 Tax=Actinomadura pelletieri DSM 43383 TaxID=1120940 RepID=A0A495QB77_9ACTN|nr:MFS transporter [Actinomadura pelletieri]RKS68935.1 EmrB/QacA subfamily drug resistance transporter [Actinomadura pelletieri DSM 43383]